jgi:quercetin dioxygenase-like cupin family protein
MEKTPMRIALLILPLCWFSAALATEPTAQKPKVIREGDLKWTQIPGFPPATRRAMMEGDMKKAEPLTYRVKFPDGFKYLPHTHPWDEHCTVLQGTLYIGIGEKWDAKTAEEMPAGSFIVIPAGTPHYLWAKGDTILQVHGMGPGGVKFINPADDPNAQKK